MAKVKITKEQAKLLGLNNLLENNVKKLKITKEQYDRLFVNGLINESEVKGGLSRVDSEFKKTFAGKNIQNLKPVAETNFDIKKPNKTISIPKDTQNFNKPIMGEGNSNGLEGETQELIKYLYRKSEELSPFWEENGLSYDDICQQLTSKGIIISKNGKYELSKKLGDPQTAIKALEDELSQMITPKDNIEEEENMNTPFKTLYFNMEIAILEKDGETYLFNGVEDVEDSMDTPTIVVGKNKEYAGRDAFGDAEYDDDYETEDLDKEVTEDDIDEYVNNNIDNLTQGVGYDGFYDGFDIVELDDELRQELIRIFDKDKGLTSILGGVNENHDEILKGFKDSFKPNDNKPQINKDDVLKKLADLRAKSQALDAERFARRDADNATSIEKDITTKSTPSEPQKPTGQMDIFGDVEETTTAASSGAFVAPMSFKDDQSDDTLVKDIPVIGETLTASGAGDYQYDTPGGLTMDLGKSNPKTKAEKVPQWAGGSFVKQPDCSKPNNNKAAQNGGCNSGASSLKTIKGKGSINAPSLGEDKIYEMISQKTGLGIDEVKRIIESKKVK